MPSDHALLGPSSAHRWLSCTPSARLEEGLPDTGSSYATEGTLAHRLGELLLRAEYEGADITEELAEVQEATETPVATTTSILDGMTVAQLKEYAANNNIDITGLTLKADIRAAIEAAEAQNGEG